MYDLQNLFQSLGLGFRSGVRLHRLHLPSREQLSEQSLPHERGPLVSVGHDWSAKPVGVSLLLARSRWCDAEAGSKASEGSYAQASCTKAVILPKVRDVNLHTTVRNEVFVTSTSSSRSMQKNRFLGYFGGVWGPGPLNPKP